MAIRSQADGKADVMGKKELKTAVLLCPVCGCRLTPNKDWAAQFYDGYCNRCDMPVEKGKHSGQKSGGKPHGKESV